MSCRGTVTSDYIEDEIVNQFHELCYKDCIVDAVLLPNACVGSIAPSGSVFVADGVAIPSFLGSNVGRGTAVARLTTEVNACVLNRDIIRNVLLGVIDTTDSMSDNSMNGTSDFIEIGIMDDSKVYVTVHSGSGIYGRAIESKYNRILSKTKWELAGFKIGSKGYVEYILDYNSALDSALMKRDRLLEIVCSTITGICGGEIKTKSEATSYTLDTMDSFLVYRMGACKVKTGGIGVVLGNIRDGVYLSGTKSVDDFIYSYPAGLGRSISYPKAGIKVNQQVIISEIKGVDAWVDEKSESDSPSIYKSIETVTRDSNGSIFSLRNIKPIISIRG